MRNTQEMMMKNENGLQQIFVRIGDEYGYRHIGADFVESCDLKIKWVRQGNSVQFWVTDYLKDAPDDILESLAETIFRRIYENADSPYDSSFIEYLTTDLFVKELQPVYLSRLGCASASPVGRYKDLRRCVDRLAEKGLVKKIPNMYMGWMPMGPSDSVGHSSPLMRSICMNERLDRHDVPDDLMDFCFYSQLKKVEQGFGMDSKRNNKEYFLSIEGYPDSERFIAELGSRGLSMWKTLSPEC